MVDVRAAHWADWSLADLVAAKGEQRVSLVVPARNEAATVGDVVARVRTALMETVDLVDEIVVIDSDSTDATYDVAASAGAAVFRAAEIRPDLGTRPGKGEAMWKSLFVTSGDLIVFMDADLLDWDTHFVPGLLGPLLLGPSGAGGDSAGVAGAGAAGAGAAGAGAAGAGAAGAGAAGGVPVDLVKGFYERPGVHGALDGGRVTELVARPLIALLFPELAGLVQPLAGEWAIRRSVFASLSVPTGYAVELAALVDVARSRGAAAIAQVDLGVRAHRHQSLLDLGGMATQILAAALARAGIPGAGEGVATTLLRQFELADGPRARERAVPIDEREPAEAYL